MEIVKVAIIGKPNVGKSSLFNRLIRKRRAIIAPESGITRDLNYEYLKIGSANVKIIDSGGFVKPKDEITTKVIEINKKLINESDIIIFMCEVNNLTIEDSNIADMVRKSSKPAILVINKVDNETLENDVYDFYSLGFDNLIPISSIHNRGIDKVKESILEIITRFYPERLNLKSNSEIKETLKVSVAIVGRPNVGKSSVLNMLLGTERSIVSSIPGTTRDAIDEEIEYNNYKIRFIDTAGIRKYRKIKESVEFYSLTRAQKAIKESDICILTIDATEGITSQDKKIADIILQEEKALILLVNKWDIMQEMNIKERDYFDQLNYQFPHIEYALKLTVSAKTGYNKSKLLNSILKVYNNYTKIVKTGLINSLLHGLTHHGIYIKYGYQKSTAPPTFEFFVNKSEKVNENYKKFIANRIRKMIDFEGTPINVFVRND